jgi:hypothetical protein
MKAVLAMTKSTDDFIPLEENASVLYEKGREKLARDIAGYLPQAVGTIEQKQGKFPNRVSVYIPGTEESFASFCASKGPSACVMGERLFISPKLEKEKERLSKILTHELSHLQLTQYMGGWDYQTKLPVWFKEGLAVYISGGGGEGDVTEDEAISAIKREKTFRPNRTGALLFRKTAHSFGLKPHMFYTQAALFVHWLHDLSPDRFHRLLVTLRSGETLDAVMRKEYGFGVKEAWKRFRAGI